MPRYMLKRGEKHRMRYTGGGSGTKLLIGPAEIELSPDQAHAIRDKLEPLNMPKELQSVAEAVANVTPENTAPEFVVKALGGGKYNVIHPETDEPINDAPLTKAQADALAASGTVNEDDGDESRND